LNIVVVESLSIQARNTLSRVPDPSKQPEFPDIPVNSCLTELRREKSEGARFGQWLGWGAFFIAF
jgi:hypothetical protein